MSGTCHHRHCPGLCAAADLEPFIRNEIKSMERSQELLSGTNNEDLTYLHSGDGLYI